ncbi:hypothetical protein RJ639_020043 [Escallonia herrerae]|uniref:Uncharacterized protein n=1 Tax=Escallonia herrerae TaxID=1293975 RepID=A0AA88V7T9_9ASTE|nr:hypothetical protein RJ639_020043 [Escallonia herrerae]
MARGSHNSGDHHNKAGAFFTATLVMWAVSVFFEILFNRRAELVSVLAGFGFYQLANWVVRYRVSRDPLFVNTCVSLLHSSVTSASGPNFAACFCTCSLEGVLFFAGDFLLAHSNVSRTVTVVDCVKTLGIVDVVEKMGHQIYSASVRLRPETGSDEHAFF